MRTSKKMVLLWVAIALAAIIVLFVLFNWEVFSRDLTPAELWLNNEMNERTG